MSQVVSKGIFLASSSNEEATKVQVNFLDVAEKNVETTEITQGKI